MKKTTIDSFAHVVHQRLPMMWRPIILISIFIGMCFVLLNPTTVAANDEPQPSNRSDKTKILLTQYEWWMIYWSDNSVVCDFFIDHEGNPTDDEIRYRCSEYLLQTWKQTPDCVNPEGISASCSGVYLKPVNSIPIQKEIEVQPAQPSIWLTLEGCETSGEDEDYCTGQPFLRFTGEEPLAGHTITRIYGRIGSKSFNCNSSTCAISLNETELEGVKIIFEADSSYGDSTGKYVAYARVIPHETLDDTYLVDIISSQFTGRPAPSGSDIWKVFPESTELPEWLDTPDNSSGLATSQKLYYLAAALIQNGLVVAGSCDQNGLATSNAANECGVSAAEPLIRDWQNQFDEEILAVAKTNNVPATLVKNTFIRESQLWPGTYHNDKEIGLSQLTEHGVDTLLLWNPDFYSSFCPLVLDEPYCAVGYALQGEYNQNLLKGMLLQKVNASCPTCENSFSVDKANYSIHVFSETLKANCSQVNRLIENITGSAARDVSSYTDLWRFTLLNYNAGAGCLGDAITRTWDADDPIDWQHVASNLDPACQNAADYVVDISRGDTAEILTFSTPLPTATATPIRSATPTRTPTHTGTPTRTAFPTITLTPTPTSTEDEVVPDPTTTLSLD